MAYTIHSDKDGFYYKIWEKPSDYPLGRPYYEAAIRYGSEDEAVDAADRHIDDL